MIRKWIFLMLVLLIPSFNYLETNSSPPLWWAIDISLLVEGRYHYPDNHQNTSGVYDFHMWWQGSMERDNGDYILYQGIQKLVSLKWSEQRGTNIFDLSQTKKPELKLNYVVRKNGNIHFDFGIFPLLIANEKQSIEIVLPCSAENGMIDPGKKYNRDVMKGSNDICFFEKPLYREMKILRQFQWEWKRQGKNLNQDHAVALEIKITQNKK